MYIYKRESFWFTNLQQLLIPYRQSSFHQTRHVTTCSPYWGYFDLRTGKFRPFRKPNDDPLFKNWHSNHPSSITGQLPIAINCSLGSDQQTSEETAHPYQNALRHSNFDHDLTLTLPQDTQAKHRRRSRSWNSLDQPIFQQECKHQHIGLEFLNLID